MKSRMASDQMAGVVPPPVAGAMRAAAAAVPVAASVSFSGSAAPRLAAPR